MSVGELGRGALAPRHGECEMRGSESPLTIKAICFEGAIFDDFMLKKSPLHDNSDLSQSDHFNSLIFEN